MTSSRPFRRLFPPLLTYCVDNFGLAIVYPIFTPLFLDQADRLFKPDTSFFHRTLLLGFLISSFPLFQLFGAPIFGALSDKVGRKKIFLITLTGGIAGYLITGIGIHFRYLPLLWFGRGISGLFAGNLTLSLAAASDASRESKLRRLYFSYMGIAAGISFVLAILVGSSLSGPLQQYTFPPDLPFFLTAFLAICAWISIFVFYKERPHTPDRMLFKTGLHNLANAIKNPLARPIYIAFFLFMIAWATSLQFLSAYLINTFNASHATITLIFVLIGSAWALSNFAVNPILSRYLRTQQIFLIGCIGLSLALFASIIRQPIPLLLFHFVLSAFFAGLAWTNSFASVSLASNPSQQGSRLGFAQSLGATAMAIGPIFGGILSGIDIRTLYACNGFAAFLAALFLLKKSS